MTTPEPPTLGAYDDGHQYRVWCEYCRYWHGHARVDGHRSAHCHSRSNSPYSATGYFIKRVGKWKDRPVHWCGKRHAAGKCKAEPRPLSPRGRGFNRGERKCLSCL